MNRREVYIISAVRNLIGSFMIFKELSATKLSAIAINEAVLAGIEPQQVEEFMAA